MGGCVLKTAWQEHYQRLYLDLPLADMIPACVLLLASAMPEAAWWVALSKLFVALRLPGRKENLSCFKHVSQRNINVGTDWECSRQADLRTHLSTKHHHLNTRAVPSLCTLTRGVFEKYDAAGSLARLMPFSCPLMNQNGLWIPALQTQIPSCQKKMVSTNCLFLWFSNPRSVPNLQG